MSLFTSALNAISGSRAAKAQENATRAASGLIQQQYDTTRADLSPYRTAGSNALSAYSSLNGLNGQDAYKAALANYTESPFLAQLVNRTRDSVESSRAARGGLFSGGTAQEIGDRTGQLYLGDFNNYLSRLGGLVDTGQNAAAQTGQFGANAASQRADLAAQAGAYKAQRIMMPAMGWQQFNNDAKSALGFMSGGGAFGGR